MPGKFLIENETDSEAQAFAGLSLPLVRVQRVLNLALDLLYPPRCVGCDRVDTVWCDRCQSQLADIPVVLHRQNPFSYLATAATAIHQDKAQSAVQALKYASARPLAIALAQRIVQAYQQLNWEVDLVVPVPMHTDRLKKRGYNQAALIARAMAEQCDLPYSENAILRQRFTRSQVGLTRVERQANMIDAFIADTNQCSQKQILLIDDVLTTGATLGGCAETLLNAGANAVFGLTVTTARLDPETRG